MDVDQEILKSDVVFTKSTLNWEIWEMVHEQAIEKERIMTKLWKQRKLLISLSQVEKHHLQIFFLM